jgi:hypothetical protein
LKQIRNRLTYANVMSSIAVFLILGGATALAASKKVGANEIKANSIKTGKIVKEAVTAGKLKKKAVTTAKIANLAVTTPKLANDAVTGEKANESTFGQVPSAKTLDGIGSTAFSRQASSAIDNDALTNVEEGTARQLNITAPQNGFLLIIASADVSGGTEDSYNCFLEVDDSEIDASFRTSMFDAAEDREENCGTNAIVPAGSGTHNVKFNFNGLETTTTVDETELDVVFVPFAG